MNRAVSPLKQKVEQFLIGPKKLYINGEFVESVSRKTFETPNPATGDTLATVYEGEKEDIDLEREKLLIEDLGRK